ncbi:MAG: hypothetical protein [Fusariviridae sp.]|nr:MAG: hypothetical protein [Fusariviridae sp.]WAK72343.1 MAG: hypothetical protein [Fusariviridae sp.]WAK72345.1 MAG: hypothetical protein [Fusariviridae sp.]
MNFWSIIRYGWTFEKDPITSNYIYGSVPYHFLESLDLMRFYLYKKPKLMLSRFSRSVAGHINAFSKKFPKVTLALVGAAASIGYFVGVGIAWSVAFKILRFIKVL